MRSKSIPAPATSVGGIFEIIVILIRLLLRLINFFPTSDSAIP